MRIVLASIILLACCSIDVWVRLQETVAAFSQWGTSDRVSMAGKRVNAIRETMPAHGTVGYEFHGQEWFVLPEIESMRYHLAPLKVEKAADQVTILIDDGKQIVIKENGRVVEPNGPRTLEPRFQGMEVARLLWAWGLPGVSLFCFLYARSRFLLKEAVPPNRVWAVWLFACSLVLGLGISSALFSLWNFFLGPPNLIYVMLESLIWLGGLLLFWRQRALYRHQFVAIAPAVRLSRTTAVRPSPSAWMIGLMLLVWIGISACECLVYHERCPNGVNDAIQIWNLRARFLYRAAGDWSEAFAPTIWHADYPLFLPACIARTWFYIGNESVLIPALLGDLFCIAMVLIPAASVYLMRGYWAAIVTGIVVLSASEIVFETMSQIADLPFACLVAIVVTGWIHAQRWPSHWLIVGLGLGGAVWMKNEGLVFAILTTLVLFVFERPRLVRRALVQRWIPFASGAGIFALSWVAFHLCFPTRNDLVAGQGMSTIAKLTDLGRHAYVLRTIAWQLLLVGPGLLVSLVLYGLLLGKAPRSRRPLDIQGPAVVLIGLFVAYYLVYVTTPMDLNWHLRTSLDRVLLHLWPSAVCLILMVVRNPDERYAYEAERRKRDSR